MYTMLANTNVMRFYYMIIRKIMGQGLFYFILSDRDETMETFELID